MKYIVTNSNRQICKLEFTHQTRDVFPRRHVSHVLSKSHTFYCPFTSPREHHCHSHHNTVRYINCIQCVIITFQLIEKKISQMQSQCLISTKSLTALELAQPPS